MANFSRFSINWVLVNELAIGPAPRSDRHLTRLEDAGIKAVMSVCSYDEALPPPSLSERFPCRRLVLPDHSSGRSPEISELLQALDLLAELEGKYGPVFVHCVAAIERSPLVCLAWLIQRHRLSPTRALDYLMQVHSGTNPLPSQLALLQSPLLQPPLTQHTAGSA